LPFQNNSLLDLEQDAGSGYYPEPVAISHTASRVIRLEVRCPSVALHGECEDGHHWAKGCICNREWCEESEGRCGGKNGAAHQRRKASWFPKARKIAGMGSFVLTLPPECRDQYRTQKSLGELGTAAKRMFQRHGYRRGLRRWHLFGEDHKEHDGDGDVPKYHPHLEVQVDGGWLRQKQKQAIKRSWANILKVPVGRINIHYKYAQPHEIRKKLHRISYALRPTFTDWRWDPALAFELVGFHNRQTWGNWEGPDVWEVPEGESSGGDLEALEQGRCPLDGTPITWHGVMPASQLVELWAPVGGGYWFFNGETRAGPTSSFHWV